MRNRILTLALCVGAFVQTTLSAADPPPTELDVRVTNVLKTVVWPRPVIQGWESNQLYWTTNFSNYIPVTNQITITPSNYIYRYGSVLPQTFYTLQLSQLTSNQLLGANLMNRLAYGPTPDEIDGAIANPQAYVSQQLAPETIPNNYDSYTAVQTNSGTPSGPVWSTVTVTGLVSTTTLYMYMTTTGQVYLDDISLAYSYTVTAVTNANGVSTTNVYVVPVGNTLTNGGFENGVGDLFAGPGGWTVSPNLANSRRDNTVAHSGSWSLRMVSMTNGSTQGSSIWQIGQAAPTNSVSRGTNLDGSTYTNTVSAVRAVLSFAYLPNSVSDRLILRTSGSGVIISGEEAAGAPTWIYATATGRATATPTLYIYTSTAGEAFIDDVKLVAGNVAGAGPNLLANGDFEQPFSNGWQATADFTGSFVDTNMAYQGASSLHLVATAGGAGNGDSIFQTPIAGLADGQTYTVSYWYRPATRGALTVRLSGSQLASTPDTSAAGLRRRLDAANWGVTLDELRIWLCNNAVGSPRQLLEVLTQFFENHFVTYHGKTSDYFDRYYDGAPLDTIATDLEYREASRWRQALLNPNCTFYDLLKVHIESPAEIIYLDTVESRGDAGRIANENYARELFELFCMGVDNGYEQNDIVAMSRAWTGWTVDIVDRENIDNPFAPRSTRYGYYPNTGYNAVSNILGVWTFVFNPAWHGTNRAPILSVWDPSSPATNPVALGPKRYAARFGAPWAGQSYQIVLPRRPTGETNSIRDGYDVAAALANNLHTAEYLSIKLCRLFVHDNFPNPTTRTNLPEYAFYDYTNPNRSAEAELIRRCIVAWDTPGQDGRKGHIRAVLQTIFNSDLFRTHASVRQKVKTPLEFVVSAVRALRSVDASGAATAFSDGNFNSPLSRMGRMSLFNRADPDGYPETGAPWISAGTLAERLRFVQTLCMDPAQTGGRPGDAGNNTVDPVALIQRKLTQPALWTNAVAVSDLIAGYLFAGEGRANLDLYRTAAVNFLNDGAADPTAGTRTQTFSQLPVSTDPTSAYDLRVRGMTAMLMTLQRFQEQ